MTVTKKPWGILMDAANDTFTSNAPIYVKYVAFETADASANGQFSLVDASSGGIDIVPQYEFDTTAQQPSAQFAVENFVGQTLFLAAIPTAGRVFVYFGRQP